MYTKEITLDKIYALDKKIYTKYYASTFVMSKLNKFPFNSVLSEPYTSKFVLNLFTIITDYSIYQWYVRKHSEINC